MSDLERLLIRCEKHPNGCWDWVGYFIQKKVLPRGQFWLNGKTISAHRASFILHYGAIEDGLHVLHRCNNSKCINPNHLYLGDHKQNMRDRDECGHTSRGEHRYNYVRFDELCEKVAEMRRSRVRVEKIWTDLGISKTTYYRIRASLDDFPKERIRA